MNFLIAITTLLTVASAQEYIHPYELLFSNPELSESDIAEVAHHELPRGMRLRRDVSVDNNGVTFDRRNANGRVFGTLGQNDNGLFGKAGVERNIFNDGRGRLDAQAHGTRTLGPAGATSAFGGALNWKGDHATASFDANKQIHGPTSWTAAGGGRWPVGRNGDIGVDATYGRFGGVKDYGARGDFNYRF